MIETFVENAARYLQDSALLAYLAVYVGGVLVSFTPCTYPVAPLTVAFIGARSSGSRSKGFFLSLVYVFGMSLTYTAIGAVAALTGKLFGQVQSNPWTFFAMANVCLFMGLSMLDVFTLPIRTPRFVARLQPREKTRGALGAFFVGAASGLVLGPCTAPVLAVLLSFAATRESVPYAMSLLFVFSFGMGTLLIILGTSAGFLANLPRSGTWMIRVSKLFGWLMIAAGEYFLIQAGMLWG